MRRPTDTAVIFGAVWLMTAMLIDALTPKELSVYLIGAALAPAIITGGLLYHLRYPASDLAITLAAFWMVAVMVIEWITPKPMSPYFVAAAIVPSILVGAWLHLTTAWRRRTSAAQRKNA